MYDFEHIIYNKKLNVDNIHYQSLMEDRVINQYVNTKFNIYNDSIELVYYKDGLKLHYCAPEEMRDAAYYEDGLITENLNICKVINGDKSRLFTITDDNTLSLNRDNITFSKALELAQRNVRRSRIRMLNQLYSYSLCNHWNCFVTLTFDRTIIDSTNFIQVNNAYNLFIKRLKYVFPDIKALFVAEYHKDKEHIHFHGFLGNCDGIEDYLDVAVSPYSGLPLTDKVGNSIYNFKDGEFWDFGFASLALLESGYNKFKVTNYLTKYIGKDVELQYGAKGLLHTRNLNSRTSFNAFLSKDDLFSIIENYYANIGTIMDMERDFTKLSIFKKETDSLIVFNLNYNSVESS